jgi:hypothetical protein
MNWVISAASARMNLFGFFQAVDGVSAASFRMNHFGSNVSSRFKEFMDLIKSRTEPRSFDSRLGC